MLSTDTTFAWYKLRENEYNRFFAKEHSFFSLLCGCTRFTYLQLFSICSYINIVGCGQQIKLFSLKCLCESFYRIIVIILTSGAK